MQWPSNYCRILGSQSAWSYSGFVFRAEPDGRKTTRPFGEFETQAQEASGVNAAINALMKRIEELEAGEPGSEMPAGKPASLNGTVRSKVLKMHRLGQSVDE